MQRQIFVGLLASLVILAGCTTRPTAQAPAVAGTPPPGDVRAASQATLNGTIRVGAPCGLVMAYKEARTIFEQRHPDVKFVEHVKNIGPLNKEIRDGKVGLDVFISLGERELLPLVKAGKVKREPVKFLRQAMQLCVKRGNPLGIKTLEDLAGDKVKTVVVCVPELTLGYAAEQALKSAGVWQKLRDGGKVIRMGQPAQAKQMVIDGKADATFIYAACSNVAWVTADPERSVTGKADVVLTVPEESYGGMFAVAVVLTTAQNPELAEDFTEFLLTPEAQDAIAKWGYGKMSDGSSPSESSQEVTN